MQVRTIEVKNFKSLVDFRLELAKFSCLIGLNGAGKSTVLQFIDFLGQQVRGDVEGWLAERSWRAKDLKSQLTKKSNIDFSVLLSDESGDEANWEASFNPVQRHCTHERIEVGGAFVHVGGGNVSIGQRSQSPPNTNSSEASAQPVAFTYQGSILSQLKESTLPEPLVRFKDFFEQVRSLDLLSPEHLRQRTRDSAGSLRLGGSGSPRFFTSLAPPNGGSCWNG